MKIMGNLETERLKELIKLAKLHNVAKTQDEFAKLIGAKGGTAISHALKGDGKYKVDTLIAKAELALLKAGVAIDGADKSMPASAGQFSTDATSMSQLTTVNAKTDLQPQPNDSSVSALQNTIRQQAEMIRRQQELINRLNREIDGLYERIDELKRASSIAAPRSVAAV